MKRKSTCILLGLSIILVAVVLIISYFNNKMIYALTNESGDRKVMQNVKFVSYQNSSMRYNQKVSVSSDGIKSEENSDRYKYDNELGIKENKDFFRTINRKTVHEVGENDQYICAAYMGEGKNYDCNHMTLCIGDKRSGKIKKYKYTLEVDDKNAHFEYYPVDIKICEGFLSLILNKNNTNNGNKRSIYNYKFDLSTGTLLKKVLIGGNESDLITDKNDKNKYFYLSDNKNNLEVYNDNDDSIKKYSIPVDFDLLKATEYDDKLYLFSTKGQMLELDSDGKIIERINLFGDEWKDPERYWGMLDIKDNKIYSFYSLYTGKGGKCIKTKLVVFDLNTGKRLYGADVTEKKCFEKTAHAADGCGCEFLNI